MAVFALGAMCAYLIIIGDTIPQALSLVPPPAAFNASSEHVTEQEYIARQISIVVCATFIILPLSLLKDVSKLSKTSMISISCDALLILLVLIRAPVAAEDHYPGLEDDYSFAKPNVFAGLGAMSFAFVCHHSSFLVYNTLEEPSPKTWKPVAKVSVSFALFCALLIGIGGYVSFQQATEGNILNNFAPDDGLINVARFLLACTMIFTFPMELFVVRHSIHALFFHGRGECLVIVIDEWNVYFKWKVRLNINYGVYYTY